MGSTRFPRLVTDPLQSGLRLPPSPVNGAANPWVHTVPTRAPRAVVSRRPHRSPRTIPPPLPGPANAPPARSTPPGRPVHGRDAGPRGRVTSYDDGPALRPPQGPLPGAALGADPARRRRPGDLRRWRRHRRQPGPRRRRPPRPARQDHAGQRPDRCRRRGQHQPRRQRPRSRGQPRLPPRRLRRPAADDQMQAEAEAQAKQRDAALADRQARPRSRPPRSSSTCGTCR